MTFPVTKPRKVYCQYVSDTSKLFIKRLRGKIKRQLKFHRLEEDNAELEIRSVNLDDDEDESFCVPSFDSPMQIVDEQV